MRALIRSAMQLVLLAALLAAPLNAQVRSGYYGSLGLGWGALGCDDCTDRAGGTSGDVSLGALLNPHWGIGVGSAAWSRLENGVRVTTGVLDVRARYYPSTTGGFFLTGGAGLGRLYASGFGQTIKETGWGALLGAGYDIPLGSSLAVTPYYTAFIVRADGDNSNVYQLGLAINFHGASDAAEPVVVRPAATSPPSPTYTPRAEAPSPPAPAVPPPAASAPATAPAPAPRPAAPPPPAVSSTAPAGTNYVADARIGVYYTVGCAEYHAIPAAHRVYFTTVGDAEKKGFRRSGDC